MTRIEELIRRGDYPALIGELRNGRRSPLPDTERCERQYEPDLHSVNDPRRRPDKLVVTDRDADSYGEVRSVNPGCEPDGDGYRIERVARVPLALQKLIVKRAVAFTFGNPVTYRADPRTEQEKALLLAIRRCLRDVKESALNRRAARSLFSATEVAELWYPVVTEEEGDLYGARTRVRLKVALLSPSLGDRLYPYFDDARDLVAFSREFSRKGADGSTLRYFETYTAQAHYLWTADGSGGGEGWTLAEGYPKPVPIGKIPVVYASQPRPEWADAQSLIDRLEKLLSNFADTNDYHASPKIFVQGHITGFARKGEAGGVIEGEQGATAQYLSWSSAPESVRLEIDTLLRMIYTVTQTPDISFDTVKGLGAVSGVALRLLFMDAHLKVQDKAETLNEYLQRRVSVIKSYLGVAVREWGEAARGLIVEPEITPYIIEDELGKINTLQAANGGKQIASRRSTIRRLGWAEDAEREEEEIQREEDRESAFAQGEPTL